MRRRVRVVAEGVKETQLLDGDAVGLADDGAVRAWLAEDVEHRRGQGQRDVLHQTRVAHGHLQGIRLSIQGTRTLVAMLVPSEGCRVRQKAGSVHAGEYPGLASLAGCRVR